MSIANQLAHPSPVAWNPHHGKVEPCAAFAMDGSGLTKRQHIAIEFAKALASNPALMRDDLGHYPASHASIAASAIKLADALIRELES